MLVYYMNPKLLLTNNKINTKKLFKISLLTIEAATQAETLNHQDSDRITMKKIR